MSQPPGVLVEILGLRHTVVVKRCDCDKVVGLNGSKLALVRSVEENVHVRGHKLVVRMLHVATDKLEAGQIDWGRQGHGDKVPGLGY